MTKQFWEGFVAFPVVLIVAILLLILIAREYRAWKEWFKGLPIFQYPAMLMLVLSCKILNLKHCKWMQYENRIWLSPMVSGFNVEKKVAGQK